MKALVIYDSIFGNTEQIAQAIGKELASQGEAAVVKVGDVKSEQLTGLTLLVVGSPTRGFRPTPAIKALLAGLPPNGLQGVRVAAFDTRISTQDVRSPILGVLVKLFGYAAVPIADALKRKGGQLAVPPEGFIVKASEGPLKEGELERAASWARLFASPQ